MNYLVLNLAWFNEPMILIRILVLVWNRIHLKHKSSSHKKGTIPISLKRIPGAAIPLVGTLSKNILQIHYIISFIKEH